MNDLGAIDRMLERLRALKNLAKTSASDVVSAIKKEIASNVAKQTDPWHRGWKPGLQGAPILTHAAAHVRVDSTGTVVQITLEGIEARHHIGTARGYHGGSGKLGGFRRNIIPPGGAIPGPMRIVIADELKKNFEKIKK
jgi:hypothetical protein